MSDQFVKFDSNKFDKVLLQLDEQIDRLNLLQIRLLSYDDVKHNHTSAIDLFDELKKKDLISSADVSYLVELLWRSWRKDLVKQYFVNDLQRYEAHIRKTKNSKFTAYRRLLHDVCENMTEGVFDGVKDYACQLKEWPNPAPDINRLQEPQELFLLMELENIICPTDYARVVELINRVGNKELTDVLTTYADSLSSHQSKFTITDAYQRNHHERHRVDSATREPTPHAYGVHVPSGNPYAYMQQSGTSQRQHMNRSIENTLDSRKTLGRYTMTARPRGICIIINNINFHVSEVADARLLKKREGGKEDLEALKKTWERLHFDVKVYSDLKATDMHTVMTKMGIEENHAKFDAFVCCVLSHGANNTVFGSDGLAVKVKDLINPLKPFTCPTLLNKPKLFFIQACQGRDQQDGFPLKTSGIETDHSSFVDNTSIHDTAVPNEADILVSYATVPGFVSYRSRSTGSFYVKHLCECLDEFHERYDLISILTEVNNRVAEMDAGEENCNRKQVPQPNTTLRKAVFLF